MDFFTAYEHMKRGARVCMTDSNRRSDVYYFIQDSSLYYYCDGNIGAAEVQLGVHNIEGGWKIVRPATGVYKMDGEFYLYDNCWQEWDYDDDKWDIANVGLCDLLDKYAEFYSESTEGMVRISYDV